MSLNWVEIDQVIDELALQGAFLQNARQSDWQNIFLDFYQPGRRIFVLISLTPGKLRFYQVSVFPSGLSKVPRFSAFLRANLMGARVAGIGQVGRERIIRIELVRDQKVFLLWMRLWGGAANVLVTDAQGAILEAAFRRPVSGEIKGRCFMPQAGIRDGLQGVAKVYALRQLPGQGSYSQRLEVFYNAEDREEVGQYRDQALRFVEKKLNLIRLNQARVEQKRAEYQRQEDWRFYGDLLMANLWRIQKGGACLEVEDWRDGGMIVLPLDSRLSPYDNAQVFYRKYRKARDGSKAVAIESAYWAQEEERWNVYRASLFTADVVALKDFLSCQRPSKATSREDKEKRVGLEFCSGGFSLYVGRNARENDELLRRWVQGNDIWLHVRDVPGGFVFIRRVKGKTVPLETLLDAANLAIFYSKARAQGRADIHYTAVKYLRKVKGKEGLVFPIHEKNLSVVSEPQRIQRLRY